jgi:uncharacterized repeat protein (TIGR01451 family)
MGLNRTLHARRRYSIGAAALALGVAALALGGAATTGQAANSPSVDVPAPTVLNDPSPTVQATPSPDGHIGYHIVVTNNGTSIANHVSVSETISAGTLDEDLLVSHGISCAVSPTSTSTSTLTCYLSQLAANGGTFDVTALFHIPKGAVGSVTNHVVVAFDSQTNGTSNHKTDPFDVTRTLAPAGGPVAESLALHGESLSAAGTGQTIALSMPRGFLNQIPFVEATLQNSSGAPRCSHCPAFQTQITIPSASTFTPITPPATDPFYDGTATAPFTWTLVLPGPQVPKGFKLTGVYHNGDLILPCAGVAPNWVPNTTTGICIETLVQDSKTKTITAVGLALTNGSYAFG